MKVSKTSLTKMKKETKRKRFRRIEENEFRRLKALDERLRRAKRIVLELWQLFANTK